MKTFKKFLAESEPLDNAITDEQILRASIIAEEDATNLYLRFADKTKNKKLEKLLRDVALEEKVHVHEFQVMLEELDKQEKEARDKAEKEAEDL